MVLKYRYLGHGFTDSNGIATLDYDKYGNQLTNSGYVGTGAGELDFIAKLHDDSTVQSETFEVLDAKIYDNFETSYNGILNMNGSGISIEISDEWHTTGSKSAKCTINTSWIGWGENPPSSFIGSTVNFKLDYKATNRGQFVAIYQKDGQWVYDKTINIASGEGNINSSMDVPSDATGVRLRFTQFHTGDIVYIDNWAIW